MTKLECSLAASSNENNYRELEDRFRVDLPLGCFVGPDGDFFYWNDGLNTNYEPKFHGRSRVCLNSQRPHATRGQLNVHTPQTTDGLGRQQITHPKMEDDQWRWIKDDKTCDDAKCPGGLADERNCLKVADDLNVPYKVQNDIHFPYGCYFLDNELVWNSGVGIRNPPRYDNVFYTHVCMDCDPDFCDLPTWAWLTIAACILLVVLVFVALCCYQYRSRGWFSSWGTSSGQQGMASPALSGAPGIQSPEQAPFVAGRPSGGTGPRGETFDFPGMRASESWDMGVPMNLFNQRGNR